MSISGQRVFQERGAAEAAHVVVAEQVGGRALRRLFGHGLG